RGRRSLQRNKGCLRMRQLADFSRRQSHASSCGYHRQERGQAFHPIEKSRGKTRLLASGANGCVSSWKRFLDEPDERFVFQLRQVDPLAVRQQVIIRQHRMKRNAPEYGDFKLACQFGTWIAEQRKINASRAERLYLVLRRHFF